MKKCLIGGLFLLITFSAGAQTYDGRSTTDKFNVLLNYLSQWYVDSVQENKLVEDAIVAMLEKLDPHTVYIPKEEVEEMNAPLKGNFDGVGIRFQIMKDTIMVVNTIPGGPSEKVGIRAGDKFVSINGENVAGIGIKNSMVRDRLLGPKGSKVDVSIQRNGVKELLHFTITRDKIPLYSIDASYMAAPEIGYIKLSSFAGTSMEEFHKAMDSLEKQGMKSLILDLQGNGGGYLQTAVDLCDQFLDDQKLIVYTEGRSFDRKDILAYQKGRFEKGKLVVLIDESSASASEIVSGAIQDWDRGLIIGRRSFGKGLVQKPISLPDGSQVRLTTQRYYTPAGRCIQKPYDEGVEAYRKEKYERYLNGELMNKDSIHIPDSLKYFTRIIKREVYGGGGIIPDIFVPIDTSMNSEYVSQLLRKGIFNSFCLEYVDQHRDQMKASYPTFADFKKNFKVDKVIMDSFIAAGEKDSVLFSQKDFDISKSLIELRLKAGIAQNVWDFGAFYEIINDINPAYRKAIEAINDDTFRKMKLAYK